MTVCGPRRAKYGVKPFHKENTPSCFDTFIRTSIDPLYSGTPPGSVFIFWILFGMKIVKKIMEWADFRTNPRIN